MLGSEKGGRMKKRKCSKGEDRVVRALDRMCDNVQNGMRVPHPSVLTKALTGLFPYEKLIPDGMCFEIRTGGRVRWCVSGKALVPVSSNQVLWLRRMLSTYM